MRTGALGLGLTFCFSAFLTGCGGGSASTSPLSAGSLNFSTASLTFAAQAVGTTSATQTVTATNSGSGPVAISSVTIAGTNASSFADTTTCATTLAVGASCSVTVSFSPSTTGALVGMIDFNDNLAYSPQVFQLSGTGGTGGASTVYVIQNNTTSSASSLLEFPAGANGSNVSPSATLTPPAGVTFQAVAVDASGVIYIGGSTGSTGAGEILVYPAGSTGNASPARTITGTATGFNGAVYSVAVDSVGQIYELNGLLTAVGVFAAGASGNVAPIRTIPVSLTTYVGMALDPSNNLYIPIPGYGTSSGSQILVYSPSANGTAAPIRTISGPLTGLLNFTFALGVDSVGNIYSTSQTLTVVGFTGTASGSAILQFPASASGNAVPARVISGAATGFLTSFLGGLAVDGAKTAYMIVQSPVTFAPSVVVYSSTANGNVAPSATITSSAWNNTAGGSIAVH